MLALPLSVLVFLAPVLVPPQTAEQIVRAAAWMHGFPTKPSADTVVVATGTRSQTRQGLPMTVEYTRVMKGEQMFREDQRVSIAMQVFRKEILFDGEAGWVRVTGVDGELSEDMTPQKVKEHQQRNADGPSKGVERLLQGKDFRLERLRDEAVGGAKVYVVSITQDGAEVATLHVDQKSLLVVKAAAFIAGPDGKKVVREESYSDFRRVGGCLTPMKVELRVDGKWVMTDATKSFEYKPAKDYPDSMFRKPE